MGTVLPTFSGDWKVFAEKLGVKKTKIQAIDKEHHAAMKQREMVTAWYDSQGTPCWEDVVTALKVVGQDDIAGKIEQCYKCGKDSIFAYCVRKDGQCKNLPKHTEF